MGVLTMSDLTLRLQDKADNTANRYVKNLCLEAIEEINDLNDRLRILRENVTENSVVPINLATVQALYEGFEDDVDDEG